jgi:hypothetical protein
MTFLFKNRREEKLSAARDLKITSSDQWEQLGGGGGGLQSMTL